MDFVHEPNKFTYHDDPASRMMVQCSIIYMLFWVVLNNNRLGIGSKVSWIPLIPWSFSELWAGVLLFLESTLSCLRAISFEKVVGGVWRAEKKKAWGGLGMVPISLLGGLQKRPISLRGGITTGPLYYCGVANFFQPTQVLLGYPSIFI